VRLRKKIAVFFRVLRERTLAKKAPFFVSWQITNRCNLRCLYCDIWRIQEAELTTSEVLETIDELQKMGTLAISFDGGEPLLRDDMGDIVTYCKSKVLSVSINTNGKLVPKRVTEIKNADYLKVSFDGPKEVHDFVRGNGAYDNTITAITAARENNLKVIVNTTLTKFNLDYIDFILDTVKKWKMKVKFQPVRNTYELYPDIEKYKKTINKLILEKKRGNVCIINSASSLYYLLNWPNAKPLRCFAGIYFCRISPSGIVYPCKILRESKKQLGYKCKSFAEAFKSLSGGYSCTGCWCTSPLELNYLLSFKIGALFNISQIIG